MRPLPVAVTLLAAASHCFGAYQYYDQDQFPVANAVKWQANGVLSYGPGLSSGVGGSVISNTAVPDVNPNQHEVAAMLRIPASGGRYIVYLNASANAKLTDAGAVGTFYAAEIWNPTHLSTGGCTANLYIWKAVNSSLTLLSQ